MTAIPIRRLPLAALAAATFVLTGCAGSASEADPAGPVASPAPESTAMDPDAQSSAGPEQADAGSEQVDAGDTPPSPTEPGSGWASLAVDDAVYIFQAGSDWGGGGCVGEYGELSFNGALVDVRNAPVDDGPGQLSFIVPMGGQEIANPNVEVILQGAGIRWIAGSGGGGPEVTMGGVGEGSTITLSATQPLVPADGGAPTDVAIEMVCAA